MEARVSLITLGVADLARAAAFYEDVVGWKREPGPPEIAFFDLGGLVLSLYPLDALRKDIGIESTEGVAPGAVTLAHNVSSTCEVDAIFERLRARGASIVKDPQEAFWGGYSGYFRDPDGHHWEVAHNPFWTVLPDGRVLMRAPD